jgi:hypothetical protein
MPPERDVLIDPGELYEFIQIATKKEIEEVGRCLEHLKGSPEDGEPVPFNQRPDSRVHICGRFFLVYRYDDTTLDVGAILLGADIDA